MTVTGIREIDAWRAAIFQPSMGLKRVSPRPAKVLEIMLFRGCWADLAVRPLTWFSCRDGLSFVDSAKNWKVV